MSTLLECSTCLILVSFLFLPAVHPPNAKRSSTFVPGVNLRLFQVDNGPQVPDPEEESLGTFLSVNDDDDDGDEQTDNCNELIDGKQDRRDLARLELAVPFWRKATGPVEVIANNANLVRLFDDQGHSLTLPVKLDAARFRSGPMSYYIEGLLPGRVTLTLRMTYNSTNQEDKVSLTVGQIVSVKLIFEDGPHARPELAKNLTYKVLTTLAHNRVQRDIKASFFVQTHALLRGGTPVGQSMITAVSEAGHRVEVHTGSDQDHVLHTERFGEHPYDIDGDDKADGQNALESDLMRAKFRIAELTGRTPTRVSPPSMLYHEGVLETYSRMGLKIQLWDVDGGDTTTCSTVQCMTGRLRVKTQKQVTNGKGSVILLLHDIKPITADNLETFLKAVEDAIQHMGRNVRFDLLE